MSEKIQMLKCCTKCNLPETYETIEFDIEGVCNICRSTEARDDNTDWDERKQLLDALIENNKVYENISAGPKNNSKLVGRS